MLNRLKVAAVVAGVFLSAISVAPPAFSSPGSAARRDWVRALTVQHRHGSPIGIDVPAPSFGWQMGSSAKGARQTGYQVLVATSRNKLRPGAADMWDSSQTSSSGSAAVSYAGEALDQSTKYFWTVRTWDEDGDASGWAAAATFETGLMSTDGTTNWNGAKWISMAGKVPRSAGAPMLRRQVDLTGDEVASARLYVSALGAYDASINGERVGVTGKGSTSYELLAPGWTNYDTSVNYMSYDVTHLVEGQDDVAVGAVLGNGWWSGRMIASGSKYYKESGNQLALKAQLLVTYGDGSTQAVVTTPGGDWKATDQGPVVADDIYDGQTTDARNAIDGWSDIDFDDSAWTGTVESDYTTRFPAAKVVAYPGETARLTPKWNRDPESITVYEDVEGQESSANGKGHIVVDQARSVSDKAAAKDAAVTLASGDTAIYDLGQNMVGVPSYTLEGPAGTKVELRFGEMLNDDSSDTTEEPTAGADGPDGSVYLANLRSAKATSKYILGGGGGPETHQDSLSFYGFRYVQVRVLTPGARVTVRDLTGEVATSALRETGQIHTNDARVNKLFNNVRWGQRGNYLWIPTDCPQRDERLGWTGDTQLFANTGLYNAGSVNFLSAFAHNLSEAASSYGTDNAQFTAVSPAAQAIFPDGSSGWSDAGVIVPWTTWQMSGDTTVVDDNWTAMTNYMDWIDTQNGATFAGQGAAFGDWLAFQKTTNEFMSDAYYGYSTKLMSEMAWATGRRAEARKYDALLENIRAAFIESYVKTDPATGKTILKSSIGSTGWGGGTAEDNSQTGLLWALKLGFYDTRVQREDMRDELAANIANGDEYKAAHPDSARVSQPANTLSVGFLGVNVLAPVLTDEGRSDVAYTLLHQDQMPSWMYSVKNGATTVWERWNSYSIESGFGPVSMNSFNHYAYGSIVEWMYEHMVGIAKDPKQPGFKHFFLQPAFDPSRKLTDVEGSYDSPYGTIESSWSRDRGVYIYRAKVPANTTATLRIPADAPGLVRQNGRALSQSPGVHLVGFEHGVATFNLPSGSYNITDRVVVGPPAHH